MEKGTVLFDASAYMLFEESGDSEAQYFDGAFELEADAPAATAAAAAEDGAQSCSYGSLSYSARLHEVDAGGDHDFRGADLNDWSGDEEDEGGGSDEEDGVVDQCCHRGKAAAASMEKPTKSKYLSKFISLSFKLSSKIPPFLASSSISEVFLLVAPSFPSNSPSINGSAVVFVSELELRSSKGRLGLKEMGRFLV